MTQEEKQLLVKALCGYFPYDVCVHIRYKTGEPCYGKLTQRDIQWFIDSKIENIKPYLRPMSSMTEKEYETFPIPYSFDSFSTWNNTIVSKVIEGTQILIGIDEITEITDWLNSHHFDYRGMIEKGFALLASEGMYND
jgi:hypothetical protein